MNTTKSLGQTLLIAFGLSAIACSGDWCKDATSTVVEGTVKGSKQVATGIAEGVKEGRKAGESVDGAAIVTSMDELKKVGSLVVHAVEPAPTGATVTLAAENTTDAPMRLTDMKFGALDKEGFALKLSGGNSDTTVPPKAKERIKLTVEAPPENVGTLRAWGTDLEIPADALKEAPPEAPAD